VKGKVERGSGARERVTGPGENQVFHVYTQEGNRRNDAPKVILKTTGHPPPPQGAALMARRVAHIVRDEKGAEGKV